MFLVAVVARPRTGIENTRLGMVRTYLRGIGVGMAVKGMSPLSSVGDTVASSGTRMKCMLCELFDACPPGFGVCVIPVTNHPTPEISATFFRESISRPIITEGYL